MSRRRPPVGLVAHSTKPGARKALLDLTSELAARSVPVLMETGTARLAGCSEGLDEQGLAARCGLLVVLGGDGTILSVVAKLGNALKPVFGINTGSLGFLSGAGASEIPLAADAIARGNFALSRRPLLVAELRCAGRTARRLHGLNDVVISRGERSALIKIEVSVDGASLTEYNADGLIVATPTGSTAYSLSAGGPILTPESGCFVITPICPHVLTNRSTVVSGRSTVEARITRRGQHVFVAVDGQDAGPLGAGDSVRIARSRRVLPLAALPGRGFAEILRQKLKWTGSNV